MQTLHVNVFVVMVNFSQVMEFYELWNIREKCHPLKRLNGTKRLKRNEFRLKVQLNKNALCCSWTLSTATLCNLWQAFYYWVDILMGIGPGPKNYLLTQWHLGVHFLNSNRKWKYSCIWEIKMDQKTKVDQQCRFFLRIFFPTHFDHWKQK